MTPRTVHVLYLILSPFSTAKDPSDPQNNLIWYDSFVIMNPFYECKQMDERLQYHYHFQNLDGMH